MSTSLFNEFNEVSAKAWKQQIQAELKGADFNEKLVTKTEDGIDIKPFYHLDDTDNFTEISTPNWNICQCFDIEDDSQLPIVLDAVERGAEQIWLQVSTTSTSIDAYLIALNKMQIKPFVSFLQTRLTALKKLISTHANQAVFYFDPIAKLGKTGNWYANQKTDLAFLKELSSQPNFTLCLALQHYQHAGANHVQQLAYAMAHLNEYLNQAENQQYTQ